MCEHQHSDRLLPEWHACAAHPSRSYPSSTGPDAKKHDQIFYTYASIVEADRTDPSIGFCWARTLEVPIPVVAQGRPILRRLEYAVNYGTNLEISDDYIQIDTLLTDAALPSQAVDVRTGMPDVYVNYYTSGPFMVKHERALRMSSTFDLKRNTNRDRWNYFCDTRTVDPDVRVGDGARLYVVVFDSEVPTPKLRRRLLLQVSATWQTEDTDRDSCGCGEVVDKKPDCQ